MKIEKPLNPSQEGDNAANPNTSFNSHGTLSDTNKEIEKREHVMEDGDSDVSNHDCEPLSKHSEVDAVGKKSSTEINYVNERKDDEESEYSSLKNEVVSGNLRLCKVNGESDDGISALEQPKTESSSSNSENSILPTSSNGNYQGSAIGARTFNGTSTTYANSSSMSSTCTDLGYHHKEIHISSMELVNAKESKQSKEKLTGAPETNSSETRTLQLAEEFIADMNLKVASGVHKGHPNVGEREQSTLLGIDLNAETTHSDEVEQQTAACSVKNVRKPIALFARCEGPICESAPEVGFKGPGKGGWKGSASTTSAFRPTCHLKCSKGSGKKRLEEIDLNVDASVIDNEGELPNQRDTSEEASPMREKFNIDLNVSSENGENIQSSRAVRHFNLNDDPVVSDPDVQEVVEPSFRKGVMHDPESCFLRTAGGPEARYVGPMVFPRMNFVPFVLRVPEQAENATRDFPFQTQPFIAPQNPVFSLANPLNVPLYPAHLNGIPAFHGVPNLVEFRGGPGPNNVMNVGPPYNQYDGMNPLENTSSRGTGMQVLATPMHPMVAQQLNDFRYRGLQSLTPMKRREPEVRWNSH